MTVALPTPPPKKRGPTSKVALAAALTGANPAFKGCCMMSGDLCGCHHWGPKVTSPEGSRSMTPGVTGDEWEWRAGMGTQPYLPHTDTQGGGHQASSCPERHSVACCTDGWRG